MNISTYIFYWKVAPTKSINKRRERNHLHGLARLPTYTVKQTGIFFLIREYNGVLSPYKPIRTFGEITSTTLVHMDTRNSPKKYKRVFLFEFQSLIHRFGFPSPKDTKTSTKRERESVSKNKITPNTSPIPTFDLPLEYILVSHPMRKLLPNTVVRTPPINS